MNCAEHVAKLRQLWVVLPMAIGACISHKGEPEITGLSASSDNSSSTSVADGESCGDAKPAAGVYCFEQHDVPSILAPAIVVGATFVADEPPRLAVFSLVGPSTIVRWENGSPVTNHHLPAVTAAGGMRAFAFDVQGTPEPELIFTHPTGASFAPNAAGMLQERLPLGFPESAFVEPGLVFPFDLGGDGQADYVKGAGKRLRLWQGQVGDLKEDPLLEFPVPGCELLLGMAAGDFNNDGLADLAYYGAASSDGDPGCLDIATHGVGILLQTESGGLSAMTMLSTGMHTYSEVRVADFDGDDADDVAVLGSEDALLLFRSLGTGAFAPPVSLAEVVSYAVGDLDGDGAAECVILKKDHSVVILDEAFGEPVVTPMPNLTGSPLATVDLNLDGVDDIAFRWQGVEAPSLALAISNP
jgi:hypothetical protein